MLIGVLVEKEAETVDEGLFLLFGQGLAPEDDDKGQDGCDDEVMAAGWAFVENGIQKGEDEEEEEQQGEIGKE